MIRHGFVLPVRTTSIRSLSDEPFSPKITGSLTSNTTVAVRRNTRRTFLEMQPSISPQSHGNFRVFLAPRLVQAPPSGILNSAPRSKEGRKSRDARRSISIRKNFSRRRTHEAPCPSRSDVSAVVRSDNARAKRHELRSSTSTPDARSTLKRIAHREANRR